MTYTMEDVMRENARDILPLLSPQEVVNAFGVDNLLKGLPPEKVIQTFTPETLAQHLPQDAVLPHMLQGQRQNILSLLTARLQLNEETLAMIRTRLEQIYDQQQLHHLLLKAGPVESLDAFLMELHASEQP